MRASRECIPPPRQGGPWASGPTPKTVGTKYTRRLWALAPWLPWHPKEPRAPWHPPCFGGGKYSHESKFIVNVLVICCYSGIDWLVIVHFVSIIFQVDSLHDYRFFSEVPSFEELQDSDSSPRREEVGRRTLRDYGGFLPAFFYRASFEMFTQKILMFVEKLQKLSLTSLQPPRE